MKLTKKLKYVLGSVGLATFAIIPASVGLVSCSKKEDKIVYYQDAHGAIFEGQPMQEGSYPFKCDFNLTDKTCAIVDWTTNEPNYMTPNLPPRDGMSESLNSTFNNTIRIPSEIVYNNEIFKVVSLKSFINDNVLDLTHILSNSIQIIEFDKYSILDQADSVDCDIVYTYLNQANLLAVLNNPNIMIDLKWSEKLSYISFNLYKSTMPYLQGCTSLTSIYIPSSIEWIGSLAYCKNLQTVNIDNGPQGISDDAFKDCSSLENIKIPESVTRIWDHAFANCTSLKEIILPSKLSEISSNTFSGCSSLKSIDIPKNLITIADGAFRNCISLINISLPSTLTSIYYGAFANCSSLKSITIPKSVTYFGEDIFYGSHPNGFKIYFHSEEQMKLFQSTNSNMEQYCEVI